MTEREFAEYIKDTKIDSEYVAPVKKRYGIDVPVEIQKIITCGRNATFAGEWRILSSCEILNAGEIFGYDFIGNKIIPLIDVKDNDFISYNLSLQKFEIVNVVDGVEFYVSEKLEDFV